jgi:hypothetical protein
MLPVLERLLRGRVEVPIGAHKKNGFVMDIKLLILTALISTIAVFSRSSAAANEPNRRKANVQ